MSRTEISVRPLEASDLDAIVRIDEKLSGQTRKEYWRRRVEVASLRPPWMSLVAETDGRPVAFLFGWVGESEFGIAEPTAWLDLIGVDPPYRGRGVGQSLVERFVASARELRAIRKVATLIDLGQRDVREFFVRRGFAHGRMIQLERPVADGTTRSDPHREDHPMASCHTAMHRHEPSRIGPGTADLRHEHEVILRALLILERAGARLESARPVDEAALRELVALLRTLADRCHHGKEEEHLFPLLRAKGVGDALAVFLEEHREGRGYLEVLSGAAPPAERAAAARRYVGLLRDHIERENEVLFPMAEGLLTADDHDALARAYAEVERDVVGVGVHDRLLAALDRLESAIPGPRA